MKNTISFLLDEGMPPRKRLLRINKRSSFNIKHITHDYKRSGLADDKVLHIAEKEGRVLVTIDWDFNKKRRIQKKTAIVKIVGGLIAKDIDDLFCKLVKLFPLKEQYFGKFISASKNKVITYDYLGNQKTLSYLK